MSFFIGVFSLDQRKAPAASRYGSLTRNFGQAPALRFLRVVKYRGAHHSGNELPLTISRAGLEVASNVVTGRANSASTERVSTGVDRLDAMLSGGYYRGSSVLITGAPGTAKTSLSAAFAESAALRGERTIFVSFDEGAEQIVRNVASIGIKLGPHVAAGTIQIHSLRARSESPEAHVAQIRSLLRGPLAQNLVVDPLSAMTQRGCEGEAEAAAIQLLDFAKTAGLTTVSTSLLGNLAPLVEHSPFRISTIADTWMHVSYEIRAGERNRALTVIKSRGTGHSNQVRELILSTEGVTLADVYSVGGEVLMGTLRWEKENDARRARALARSNAELRRRKAELALAGTKAQLDALAREQAIQEAELAQLTADAATEIEDRSGEDDELLQRRRGDELTPSARAAGFGKS
jgi:circadian clock protein KaiC